MKQDHSAFDVKSDSSLVCGSLFASFVFLVVFEQITVFRLQTSVARSESIQSSVSAMSVEMFEVLLSRTESINKELQGLKVVVEGKNVSSKSCGNVNADAADDNDHGEVFAVEDFREFLKSEDFKKQATSKLLSWAPFLLEMRLTIRLLL